MQISPRPRPEDGHRRPAEQDPATRQEASVTLISAPQAPEMPTRDQDETRRDEYHRYAQNTTAIGDPTPSTHAGHKPR